MTIGGLPDSAQVMLNVHLGSPTAAARSASAPAAVLRSRSCRSKAKQNASGRVIVTTNAAGQVRLHLSAGTATIYIDVEGWFSAS